MIRAATPIACLGALLMLPAAPARAELTLCNRTSYLMDAAIGLAKAANVTTRGWFRVAPGQCRQVLDGPLDADFIYLHGRTPPVYGTAPLPANGDSAFCVGQGDFTLADARDCPPGEPVRFGQGPDRQSCRRSRLRRRPGAPRRHPAAVGDRGLRRDPDRRRRRRQD